MKKVILFDLDGTLLPMDQDKFTMAYFNALIKKLAELGLPAQTEAEQKLLAKAIWQGTYSMMKNDGSCTNEERFFLDFSTITGRDLSYLKPQLDGFYQNEFNSVEAVCGKNPLVPKIIDKLKKMGCRVAVATNPLFPLRANERRLAWAGLSLSDFEYCTCYENSRFCKPSHEYYQGTLKEQDKLAIVLGTEGDGLSKDAIGSCDFKAVIPMYHQVDSLNVAAAGAVAFWELKKEK